MTPKKREGEAGWRGVGMAYPTMKKQPPGLSSSYVFFCQFSLQFSFLFPSYPRSCASMPSPTPRVQCAKPPQYSLARLTLLMPSPPNPLLERGITTVLELQPLHSFQSIATRDLRFGLIQGVRIWPKAFGSLLLEIPPRGRYTRVVGDKRCRR